MAKKFGRVIQKHHSSYEPEVTVKIFKGEHRCITLMNRYSKRTVSKGFIHCLELFIDTHMDKVVDLEEA